VLAVYEVTRAAVDRARAGEGVTLIELLTYRRKGHAEHDNQSYVSKEELEAGAKNDPIDRYIQRLTESRWATREELARLDDRVHAEIEAAVTLCENEPLPEAATALDAVLGQPARAELEWYRRLDG
jgi:TPP-dependent pyruvate/acetoin dehydrogenase alpha subunit